MPDAGHDAPSSPAPSSSSSSSDDSTVSRTQVTAHTYRQQDASLAARKKAADEADKESKHLPSDIFSISDEELAERYSFREEIGYGNWGSVWKCQERTMPRHERKTLVIKLVHRDKSETTAARVRSLWGEFKTLRHFKTCPHPNVIAIQHFLITPSYALLSMAHHPRLLPVGPRALGPAKWNDGTVGRYLQGLLKGVEWLHRNGVAHNDVKPANVVLSEEDEAVLIDFGFATSYGPSWRDLAFPGAGGAFYSDLSWGTPEYLSPERARGSLHDERLSDLWAVGVTMYEVAVGRTPFEKDETEEFLTPEALKDYYKRTLGGRILGEYSVPPMFEDLVLGLIRPDVKLRLGSATAALAHSFFTSPRTQKHPHAKVDSPPRRRRSMTIDAASPTKSNRAYSELAKQDLVSGGGLAPAAPVASLQHKRVTQLTDAASPSTPSRSRRDKKQGRHDTWNPRTTVGKASLGTDRERPVDSHSVRTPTNRAAGGTPRSRRAIKVFEDKANSSGVLGTPTRNPNDTPRRPLVERRNNVEEPTKINSLAPAGTVEGKENGARLPLAAAKLEREKAVTVLPTTIAPIQAFLHAPSDVRAEGKMKPAPPKNEDVFMSSDPAVSSEGPPSSRESTTGVQRPAAKLKIDPAKRAALDDFLRSKPAPSPTVPVAPDVAVKPAPPAGTFNPWRRLAFGPVGEVGGDTTGRTVKEQAAKLTPTKPTRLRKRAPTTNSKKSLAALDPLAAPSSTLFPSLEPLADDTSVPDVKTGLRRVFTRRDPSTPRVRIRARTISQTYTLIDRTSLALDRAAPFDPASRIKAFQDHVQGVVTGVVERTSQEDRRDGIFAMTPPSPPKLKRRASIATGSPSSSPDHDIAEWVKRPIIRPSKLRIHGQKAEEEHVRRSDEVAPVPTPRKNHRRGPSNSSSLESRLSASYINEARRDDGLDVTRTTVQSMYISSDGSTPKNARRQTEPDQVTPKRPCPPSRNPSESCAAFARLSTRANRGSTSSCGLTASSAGASSRRSSRTTAPTSHEDAASAESVLDRFKVSKPRVHQKLRPVSMAIDLQSTRKSIFAPAVDLAPSFLTSAPVGGVPTSPKNKRRSFYGVASPLASPEVKASPHTFQRIKRLLSTRKA